MKMMRYKTNRWLWSLIAFFLFAPCWFVPVFLIFKGPVKPIDILKDWLAIMFSGQQQGDASQDALMLLIFSLIVGSTALVLAWPLQCLIVIFKNTTRQTKST